MGLQTGPGVYPYEYVHCDGTPLRLIDSNIGSEQYNTSDYYVWPAETRSRQLLFTFPTRVNLTTITLHYYSDSVRDLPRLRFWDVSDDFEVWEAPISSYRNVEVVAAPPSGESTDLKNISISFNSITMKILLYKFASTFSFALSEVEFFNICSSLKVNSLTRDPTTASQYKLYVTEVASTISRTSSKLLVGIQNYFCVDISTLY